MPLGKSPILQNDLMAEGDNQKYLLFNDALVNLEDAANRALTVDLTSGDIALNQTQTTRYGVIKCEGNTVARTLTIPISVGSPPVSTNRVLAVRNEGTAAITVTHNNAGLDLLVPAATTALLYADGTDIISLGGVANAATIPISDDGVEVVAQLSSLNFAGAGYVITNTGGAVTITLADTNTDTFATLTDTPATYVGEAGKAVVVNGTEDGLEFVTAPVTGAAIKSLYEGEADTNAYTDAEKTKLAGIEAAATADQTGAEIKSLYEGEANTNAFTDAEKAKLAALEASSFKGTYLNVAALDSAHPAPAIGSYAYVDAGIGSDVENYIWDDDDSQWVKSGGTGTAETAASVKSKYESNADTNAFTDALLAKLTGVEAGATADLTAMEIEALLDAYYAGTTWRTGGGGSSVEVQDEGITITGTASLLDFAGAGVTVTDNGGGSVTITIPGGGGGTTISVPFQSKWFGARKEIPLYDPGTFGEWIQIPLSAALVDPYGFDSTNEFVIPANVTKVRLSGVINSTGANDNLWRLYLNGVQISPSLGGVNAEVTESSYSNGGESWKSGVLDVVAGDTIALYGFVANFVSDFTGWIEIEAVEHFLDTSAIPAIVSGDAGKALVVNPTEDGFLWDALPTTSMVQTELPGTTHTVDDTDLSGNVIRRMNNAAATTITVAPSLTGTEPVTFIQTGAGVVSFAAGVGVTLHSAGGHLSIADQYGSATLIPDSTTADTYYLIGNLVT